MVIKNSLSKSPIVLLFCTFVSIMLYFGCGGRTLIQTVDKQVSAHIEEAFLTEKKSLETMSSVAFWHGSQGQHQAIATLEYSDVLVVYDAIKGTIIKRIGKPGTKTGEFKNPIDLEVVEDLIFVLDSGNHRVQVLKLPDFTPFGIVGSERLKNPSKLTIYFIEPGCYYLYVADSYEQADDKTVNILRYSIATALVGVSSDYLLTFGYSPDAGYLRNVETLAVDQAHKNLIIVEKETAQKVIKQYTLDGEFTGKRIE